MVTTALVRYSEPASEDTVAIDEPGGHRRDQRFGEMPCTEEVDRDHPHRITDARRHTRDVEKHIHLAADGHDSLVDRGGI